MGRAFHEGDMIPAKVIPSRQVAYISYGGAEIPKHDYQVRKNFSDFFQAFRHVYVTETNDINV